MLKAVLFDMDGVIVDTEPLHKKAYYKMFENFNLNVCKELYDSFTGQSTKNVCKYLKEKFELKNEVEELIQTKRLHFKELFDNDPDFALLPGVYELIQDLYANDIKLVLASSASMNTINWVFDRFNLHSYFTDKISGASLSASKPNPEIFEIAAKLANAKPQECIVIEDSTSGLKAAHGAGIVSIAYNSKNSHNQDYTLAKKVISSFNEINTEKMRELIF